MVNYCCVQGCGRNSRSYKLLNFYCLPKEEERQVQWLTLAKRPDLIEKRPDIRSKYRICSRHFAQSSIKNKHLHADAVPSTHLPGSTLEVDDLDDLHGNILCNCCKKPIYGFRYKCLVCPDFDLCSVCEMIEEHSHHYVIRIPKPVKIASLQDKIQQVQGIFTSKTPASTLNLDSSSDDEPITKYVKNYDSSCGVDLPEDIKNNVRNEVTKMLKLQREEAEKQKLRVVAKKRVSETERMSKKQQVQAREVPEMVFADVSEVNPPVLDVKHEVPIIFIQNTEDPGPTEPVIQMKLSDDLSVLMMGMND